MNDDKYTLEDALDNLTISNVGEIRDADLARQLENARRNPRQLRRFRDRLTELCTLSEEVAGSCTYSLPRGGKRVVGASVRFAELVAAAYPNLHISTTIINVDDDAAVIRGAVLDLETNVLTEGDVRRRVTKKKGAAKADEDMKNLAVASGSAIAYRNAVFKSVPRALWEDIWHLSQEAATGKGTMVQRREAAIGMYAKYGATEEQVLRALGRAGVEEITQDDLRHLRGMVTAIRTGDLTLAEALRPLEEKRASGTVTVESPLVARAAKQPAQREQKPVETGKTQAGEPFDIKTGEVFEREPAERQPGDDEELPDEFA